MKEQKQKTIKSENAITLIALVITIIVLLILAAVSIATLAGPNGILTQANEAKIEQSHSAVKEGIILAYGEYQIETKTSSKNQQIQEIAKIASTEITNIPGKQERSLAGQIVTFFDFLQTKGYINAEGIINVKNLLGQTVALGNGTTTDIYEIEQQTDTYVLNYYGENNTSEKLWELKRDDVVNVKELKIYDCEDKTNVLYTIQYEEGMTWREWVETQYNNEKFECSEAGFIWIGREYLEYEIWTTEKIYVDNAIQQDLTYWLRIIPN